MTDFEITGNLLSELQSTADAVGLDLAHLIENVLRRGAGLPVLDRATEVRQQNLINQGNNGFHLVTLVTDGYGNIVAENSEGVEGARIECTDSADPDDTLSLMEVTRRYCANLALGRYNTLKMLNESQTWLACEICHLSRPDVVERPDYFARDVNNEADAVYVACDPCDQKRSEDI